MTKRYGKQVDVNMLVLNFLTIILSEYDYPQEIKDKLKEIVKVSDKYIYPPIPKDYDIQNEEYFIRMTYTND